MPSLDFPSNPTDQQTYTLNGITYQYNASIGAWLTVVVGSQPVTLANNKQVLYSNNGLISGTNGLVYDNSANTLYANTVIANSINVITDMRVTRNLRVGTGTVDGNFIVTGNVGIGIQSPSYKLQVDGSFAASSITETSSIVFKENIEDLSLPTDLVLLFKPVTYDRIDEGKSSKEIGLIAEDVFKFAPELVSLDGEGNPHGIYYTRLAVYLLKVIKELKIEIEELKKTR